MKLFSLTSLAAVVATVSFAATAQQPPLKLDGAGVKKVTPPSLSLQRSAVERDFGAYRFTSVPEFTGERGSLGDRVLLAGTEMVNTISGKPALVSGILSVHLDSLDANEVAAEHGLKVVQLYDRLGIALLEAPVGTDMLSLQSSIERVNGVRAVEVEIVEERRQLHVLR